MDWTVAGKPPPRTGPKRNAWPMVRFSIVVGIRCSVLVLLLTMTQPITAPRHAVKLKTTTGDLWSERDLRVVEPSALRRLLALTAAALRVDELNRVRDDLRRMALVAALVLPFADLNAPLYEGFGALPKVLCAILRGLSPDDHAVPSGALFALVARLVKPALTGRSAFRRRMNRHRWS